MKGVQARKQAMVDSLRRLHLDRYRASGAELIMGQARFVDGRTVDVELSDGGQRRISGERVFLDLGTHATVPNVPGLAAARPMTHVELLDLDRLPEHLIVLGGGYVGLELAQAMRRFGARVTVIESGPQLAGREDADVGAAILELVDDVAPLADALAAQTAEARSRRAARRAETAARAAPKIQLVVALLLVPAVLLLIAAALIPALG
jgi:pyruvate/2-oxoglutarate dehydrogenase complex dihydrolipoamide dehydrogenase (E3) component